MKELTREIFLKDVDRHKMTILRDDGLYRHVRFGRPGTRIMQFDLITWPGYLAYCGDMGEYVFTRLKDMFEFFRKPDARSGVDLQYWAEKCRAVDHVSGIKKYDPDVARKVIIEWMESWMHEQDVEEGEEEGTYIVPAELYEVRDAVIDDVLSCVENGEHDLRETIRNFECNGFEFRDFWEADLTEYTVRFVWCCYALVWGIAQYDKEKATA